MDNLFSLIVAAFFVIIAIINAVGRAKQKREVEEAEKSGKPAFQANADEITRFLRSIGVETEDAPKSTTVAGGPPGMPQGRVVPTAPRTRARTAEGAWPPPPAPTVRVAPPPAPTPSEEGVEIATHRRVPEDERIAPSVLEHLKSVRLEEGEHTLEPTVESHLRERRLEEGELPLVPTIEAHLKVEHLEDLPAAQQQAQSKGATGAAGQRQMQGAGTARRRGITLTGFDGKNMQQAFVMSEIVSAPLALREGRSAGVGTPRVFEA